MYASLFEVIYILYRVAYYCVFTQLAFASRLCFIDISPLHRSAIIRAFHWSSFRLLFLNRMNFRIKPHKLNGKAHNKQKQTIRNYTCVGEEREHGKISSSNLCVQSCRPVVEGSGKRRVPRTERLLENFRGFFLQGFSFLELALTEGEGKE